MCSISKVLWYTILCLYHICYSLDISNVKLVQDKPSAIQDDKVHIGNDFISSRSIRRLKRQTYGHGHYDRRRNLDREYEQNRADYERKKVEYERRKREHERRLAEHNRRRLELEQRTRNSRGRNRELTDSSTQQRHAERSRVTEIKGSRIANQIKDIKKENRVESPGLRGQFEKKPVIVPGLNVFKMIKYLNLNVTVA
ncbi:hypothetical protein LOTGIDRAFT_171755 [Lottia gigantea]|uniref:Uncharacterized protein n=1 Tax=Lottia gigantea TaxID=225164 RepID=V4AZJ1_LOTGI|nr:hypothetical protein LOTGIDRAFT_171755 [Lottia gigantea]ESP03148.1 hypothetical protein LOTGIDRAFT_171755 [Lottia gigantea]